MLRISTHIERVLLVNDCVIIPDFGGFVLQRCPAHHAEEEYAFYPAYKEVVFNPSLNHNDGLMVESYMEIYGMDFNQAQAALKSDVLELKKMLDSQESVSLGIIGRCRKKEQATLVFEPERNTMLYSINSYGLPMFHMAPVESEHKRQEAAMKTTLVPEHAISTSSVSQSQKGHKGFSPLRLVGQVTGVAAAACVLFFLITTPVKDIEGASYKAGFVFPEMMNIPPSEKTEEAKTTSFTERDELKEEPLSDTSQVMLDSVSSTSAFDSENSERQLTRVPKSEIAIEKATSRTYYVIIASFDTQKRARQFVSEIASGDFQHVGIVQNEEKIRVYADKYDNRVEAETYVFRLRENEKYKTAWLFIGR